MKRLKTGNLRQKNTCEWTERHFGVFFSLGKLIQALVLIQLPTPGQELVGNAFFSDLAIGFWLAEHMPDDD